MSRKKLSVIGFSAEDIRQLINKDEKFRIGVRLSACSHVALGKSSRELEAFYDVSFKTICNWVNALNKEGIDGLKDKPGRGRVSSLDALQLAAIKDVILTQSPEQHGYNTGVWTGSLLIDFIAKKYGVHYKKTNIYWIMKTKLGLSHKKGKGFYPEADPQLREDYEDQKKTAIRKS